MTPTDGLDLSGLTLEPAVLAGFVLAITRVAAFVVISPLLPRSIPATGRLAFTLAVGLFLAEPATEAVTLQGLLGAALVNAVVGGALGYLTGIAFHLFAVAGGLIDLTSGLSIASLYDPSTNAPAAVFSRIFSLTAAAAFLVLDGLQVIVRGLALSVRAIPLTGSLQPDDDLATAAVEAVGRLMVHGLEIALPVVGVLFIVEVVLGLFTRLAPQANILVLGLSAKMLVTLWIVGASLLLFPEALDGVSGLVDEAFRDTLMGLRA